MARHLHIHKRLIALVNKAHDAEHLRELLDPRGEFLEPWIIAKVLGSKQSRREHKFTDIGQIRQELADEQLFDAITHALEQAPWTSHPMLLLPLRLETRFMADKLFVRIYPDHVFVNTHEEAVTEIECKAVDKFKSAPADNKQNAWRILSSQFGPLRAAWLARWADNHDFAGVSPPFRSASWTQAPSLVCLPNVFWVFAYRDGSLVYAEPSNPIRADSTILAAPFSTVQLCLYGETGTRIEAGKQVRHNPNGTVWTIAETVVIGADHKVDVSAQGGFLITATHTTDWTIETPVVGWEAVQSLADSTSVQGLFDNRSKWMHDLPTALRDGFAVEFDNLSQQDLERGFDRLIAVGMKWTSASQGKELVERMFDNHHYSSGVGFVASGTPTNNTAEVKSPYSSLEDHDTAYETEIEGPLNWEAQSQGERRTNAHRLADALGIDPERLRYIQGSGSIGDSYADEMNTIIWKVTGDYYLRYLLPEALDDQHLDYIRTHVREFVRGGGPLPTLRIKRQPYGILPVSRVKSAQNGEDGWTPWDDDGNSSLVQDRALHRVVSNFHQRWLNYAHEYRRVPRIGIPYPYLFSIVMDFDELDRSEEAPETLRQQFLQEYGEVLAPQAWVKVEQVGSSWKVVSGNKNYLIRNEGQTLKVYEIPDPDEPLLRILAMEPHSVSYRARPFVDEGFIAFNLARLRDYVFGSGTDYETLGLSPLEWMSRWSDTWEQEVQEDIACLLAELTGIEDTRVFHGEPLLKILAWWEGEDNPVGMVHDPDDKSIRPLTYLSELCTSSETDVDTLLADMGERALSLAAKEPTPESLNRVRSALCQLSSTSALGFFNAAENPEQIVQRIKDDPERDAFRDIEPPYAYGIRLDLARRILQRRSELGGRFQSLGEINAIKGVGPDTFHDIVYSFRDFGGQPDVDRLFRESLDLASHRVDAWVTSFATKRLDGIRAKQSTKTGIHLGAYGFVEGLKPRGEKPSEGYIHAPSTDHAAAAAVLYNAFLTHDPKETSDGDEDDRTENPYHINLTSDRVRKAMRILEGIRQGQPLGAVLGYQFERALQDHREPLEQYIDDFRERFPIVAHKVTPATDVEPEPAEVVAARNVVDGAALVRDAREEENKSRYVKGLFSNTTPPVDHIDALAQVIATLEDTVDAVGDLLITESTYQAVRGNYERSGAALEAPHGNLAPPELEFVTTPVPGRMFSHRVCLLFNNILEPVPDDPRGAAEPRIAGWFDSVLGNWEQIRIGFDYWEKEEDPKILGRVNVNTANLEELDELPEIGPMLAGKIIEERCSERGPFRQIADLQRVHGIAGKLVQELRPLVTTGYVERVNVNTASRQELETLPITTEIVENIMEARDAKRFARIKDLKRVIGIGDAKVAELRPHVTTGLEEIGLDELGLSDELGFSAADFLYVAQATPEGGETELEQRIGRIVRDEFSLPATQRIEVFPRGRGEGEYSLENAVELAQQVLRLLAAGQPMTPDTMCHPGDIKDEGYTAADVETLGHRVDDAHEWLSGILEGFNAFQTISRVRLCLKGEADKHIESGTVRHIPTGTVWAIDGNVTIGAGGTVDVMAETIEPGPPIVVAGASDWSIETAVDGWDSVQSIGDSIVRERAKVVELLPKAAKLGIYGAYPPAVDDPQLLHRFENARAELGRRKAACERLIHKAESIENPDGKIRQLTQAMQALFGKSFICLPTFAPHQPEDKPNDLNDALAQDILNGLGKERLRLWMQQAAEVRSAVAELVDTLMLIEGWSQATLAGNDPSLELKVVQLPFTKGRNWLGLSISEGAEAEPNPGWTRSPLSVFAAVNGTMPVFTKDTETAGLVLDEWSELIPARRVNTSVAFQYDAPNTQPPQALLLAVPGQMKEIPDVWTPQELAAIVNDTIDLAKVRAVDIDALAADPNPPVGVQPERIGGIVPGIYLPTDPDQPGWAREVVMNTIDEWIETLNLNSISHIPRADFEMFLSEGSFGPAFDDIGFGVEALQPGDPISIQLGHVTFPASGIRFFWNSGTEGRLSIVLHAAFGMASLAPATPNVIAYSASGNPVDVENLNYVSLHHFIVDASQAVQLQLTGGEDTYGERKWAIYSLHLYDN